MQCKRHNRPDLTVVNKDTQEWTLVHIPVSADQTLQSTDRETRKLISENGGRHPLNSTAVLYLPRDKGGGRLKSVEQECKLIKMKAAIKLYENPNPMMRSVNGCF